MRVQIAVALMMIAVLLGSLVAIGGLNAIGFGSFLVQTYSARLLVVGTDLRDVIDRGVGLGLPLRQFSDVQNFIDDVRRNDPSIVSITVYEIERGDMVAVYSTERATIGQKLRPEWRLPMVRDEKAGSWRVDDANTFGVLLPIENSFNQRIGGITLLQSNSVLSAPIAHTTDFIRKAVLIVAAISVLPLSLAAALVLRRFLRRVREWTDYAQGLSQAAAAGTAPPQPLSPGEREAAIVDEIVMVPFGQLADSLNRSRAAQPAAQGADL